MTAPLARSARCLQIFSADIPHFWHIQLLGTSTEFPVSFPQLHAPTAQGLMARSPRPSFEIWTKASVSLNPAFCMSEPPSTDRWFRSLPLQQAVTCPHLAIVSATSESLETEYREMNPREQIPQEAFLNQESQGCASQMKGLYFYTLDPVGWEFSWDTFNESFFLSSSKHFISF